MDQIRIVYILSTLEIGGTETQLLEVLRRLDRTRFAPRVLAFPHDGPLREALEALSVPVAGIGFFGDTGRQHPRSYWQLLKLLLRMVVYFRHKRPHIVQSFLFWANVWGTLAAKAAGVPVILTGRREMLKQQHRRFPDQWLQNLANRWVTGVVVNAGILKEQCLAEEQHLLPEKVHILYNGIDISQKNGRASVDVIKKNWQIPSNHQVVGMVANVRPVKGPHIFFQAAARVLQTCPNTVFMIVGRYDGMRVEIEHALDESGIRQVVRLTGYQANVAALLATFDVQVCASLEEGLSNALLEGMRLGKPIVATGVGGNPELVNDGSTGILVPPNNAGKLADGIIRLLNDSDLRIGMGQNGRRRAQRLFGMKRLIRETESLYERLVSL